MFSKCRLGVLISGRGSNLKAVLEAIQRGLLDAEVVSVISNKEDAGGLAIARDFRVDAVYLDRGACESNHAFEKQILALFEEKKVDLVVLAGYMRIVGQVLLGRYENRMINIHPSLLPSFKGLHAQRQALEYGVKIAGCSAHIVTEDLDSGPILLQEAVPVYDDDTEAKLSQRILEKEHEILPQAIQGWIEKNNKETV